MGHLIIYEFTEDDGVHRDLSSCVSVTGNALPPRKVASGEALMSVCH